MIAGCNRTPGTEGNDHLKAWKYEPRPARREEGARTLEELIPVLREAAPAGSEETDEDKLFGEDRIELVLVRRFLRKMAATGEESDDIPIDTLRSGNGDRYMIYRHGNSHASKRAAQDSVLQGSRSGLPCQNQNQGRRRLCRFQVHICRPGRSGPRMCALLQRSRHGRRRGLSAI